MIRRLGVEQIRLEEFTPSFARKTPEEFADYLARDLHAHSLVAGFNYSFAHQGMGDCVLLAKLCRERDMGLYVIPPVKVGDTVVSSTAVRQALAAGALERANQLLGYEYSLSGEITDGRKVGRNIGYPTANLTLTEPKVLPPNGVYLTRLRLGDEVFRAVTNIGVRPTFDDADSITIETFIPGFNGNLYGRDARLSLVRFLRHEQRFSCMDELKKQIAQDVLIATEYFRHEQPPVSPY